MGNNQNGVLLLAVVVSGLLSFFIFTNNFSLKGYIKPGGVTPTQDGYTSPFGPKPTKAWEQNWETERTR